MTNRPGFALTTMIMWILAGWCTVTMASPIQEAIRQLEDAQQAAKYLTPGEIDSWVFEGKQDETVIVVVSTNQFDPVIGLAKVSGESEVVLFSIDDEGSTSRFSYRLTADGTYKIRVHGFEMKGGGNYDLNVQRFVGRPIEIDQRVTGRFDRNGQANFFVQRKRDENMVIDSTGTRSIWVWDPKGDSIKFNFHTNILINRDGEHLINLRGPRGHHFSLVLRTDQRATLTLDGEQTVETSDRTLYIWEIDAEPGQFRYLTVTRNFDVDPRLIFAPHEIKREKLLDEERKYKEIEWLPISNKGDLTRYAVVFGRKGRYQLQVLSHANTDLTVSTSDPTIPIERGEKPAKQIPIGGTHFYGFAARAGDLIEARLDSNQFDCYLRLFDGRGQLVAECDDGPDTKNSHITHMVTCNSFYRWHVASLGDGGGGDYQLAFREIALKQLEIGQTAGSQLVSGTTEFWSLEGEKDKSIFLNVRSADFNPRVAIYKPDGSLWGQDDDHGVDHDSLLAVEFPDTGRYTVWVTTSRDGGKYDIRVIDADWVVD